jgi:DNA polymerase I
LTLSLRLSLVARELRSGRKLRLWRNQFGPYPPYSIGPDSILAYCEQDVAALARLLPPMLRHIDLPRALLRGRYMAAAATMEHNGVPVDAPLLSKLREKWAGIQDRLIAGIDANYGVFEGPTFKVGRFAALLERQHIPWPRLDSGKLDLSDDAFRQAARAHPYIAPLRELRSSLSDLRLSDLAVGEDRRNRCLLSAFRSRTGRNQPSNSRFIFGPSVWLRGLIKPPPDYGLAYIDWAQQEFGIATALSGDPAMMDAYLSGDPYLAFAKQAGAVPAHATKHTHHAKREQFKSCVLAVQYGMGHEALAARIGQPTIMGRELIRLHQETYRVFWRWSDAAVDHATLHGSIETVFGWRVHTSPYSNPRFFRNFPMQANGAEMLRLACCLATERGIEVCTPVHDAVLIAAPLSDLDEDVAAMREAMREASSIVLAGFDLGTDVKMVCHPNRYADPRGKEM